MRQLKQNPRTVLPLENLRILCDKVKAVLMQWGTVIEVETPVVVCGDIHGQFDDLMNLFETAGSPSSVKYLFLGDYVDRGRNSLAVIIYLFELLIKDRVYLLRGNHECRMITQTYGFYDECLTKYGDARVWRMFMDTCDYLPLGAIVGGEAFCCHGGLSDTAQTIDEFNKEDRIQEIPTEGLLCDLCWSDPVEDMVETYKPNERGAGVFFWAASDRRVSSQQRSHLHLPRPSVKTTWLSISA